jgi:hypothetical protein
MGWQGRCVGVVTPLASGLHNAPRNSSLWSDLGYFARSAANFDRISAKSFQFEGATGERGEDEGGGGLGFRKVRGWGCVRGSKVCGKGR